MKRYLIIILITHSFFGFSQVRLNEMQSSNATTIADDFGEYDDWVEIHNSSTDSVEIGGLILKDQLDTWAIPTGDPSTHLPPGGYFLLWADDQEIQGIFHTNFKLASGGEFLGLYESNGVTVIDSITIPAMTANQSYMRCSSGWMTTNTPTPLTQNDCSASIDKINFSDNIFSITSIDNGTFSIEIHDYAHNQYELSLYAMDGKKIMSQVLQENTTTLNHQVLDSGIYIAIVSTNNSVYSQRIWVGK